MPSGKKQQGYTLLALLLLVALIGFGLAGAGELWSRSAQRERERELLFAGNQIRDAIGRYYLRSPGTAKRYPRRIEDLLQDDRYPVVVRYLRRAYADPMTGSPQWGLIEAPGGGIMGVYSLSGAVPLKRAGFAPENKEFEGARRYTEWRFLFNPEAARAAWAERTTPRR
ncbi:MAG TPA: type II secretion system protein [Burkholderiales bacterium]|jgi:type II secretory pathway pseudopilin PulG|nr:type II secretion system protein [Burkholderiales bacterium]